LVNLIIALVAATVAIAVLAKYLPRTSLYRRFALVTSNPSGPSLDHIPRQFANAVSLTPGTRGVTVSMLRPSGKARFSDQLVDVITDGEFVAPETPVTVVQSDGMRVVVKPIAA